jgi:signal peptidase II
VVEAGAFAPALGSVILIDQALKAVLLARLPDGRAVRVGLLRIGPSRSRGPVVTALGFPAAILPLLWLAILLAVLLLAPEVFEGRLSWGALGASLGGAASNLVDLLVRGGIVDYIDLRVWPAFNLADAAIVSGVLVALVAG